MSTQVAAALNAMLGPSISPVLTANDVAGSEQAGADGMSVVAMRPSDTPVTSAGTQAAPQDDFGQPTGAAGAVGGTVLALLLVVGFILALAWLARRMPGIAGASGAGSGSLRVVGSLALGPRERVVVVAVGDTQLLLSTGPGGTRTLHTLAEPLPVAAPASAPFAQVLAQQFGKASAHAKSQMAKSRLVKPRLGKSAFVHSGAAQS